MKTIFKVGMEVYDQIFFGETPLKIIEVKGDMTLRVLCGEVTYCYTGDGRFIGDEIISNRHRGLSQTPTLSISPYKLEGFRQAPTFGEALKWLRDEYLDESVTYKIDGEKYFADYYYSKNAPYKSFEALRKLTILRDYYNNGFKQEDLGNIINAIIIERVDDEYQIVVRKHLTTRHVLFFKSEEIAFKFLEEQKELLEIAKPLL